MSHRALSQLHVVHPKVVINGEYYRENILTKDPDLNPIENLWSIIQQEVDKMTPATSAGELAKQLKKAWGRNKPDVLENLVVGMPPRMHDCSAMKGGYIGK